MVIDSHLKENLIEHINAEIAQGTITSVDEGINFMKYTFMHTRMKNSIKKASKEFIDEQLKGLCLNVCTKLKEVGLITEMNNFSTIYTTCLGKKMSKNYVYFETMKNVFNMNNHSEEYILEVLSNSFEFSKYRSKLENRKILNNFNKDHTIKYKIKGVIDTSGKKAFLLIQAALSNLVIDQWELRREQNEILSGCIRIINCMKAYFKMKQNFLGYSQCLLLKKSINQRMWNDTRLICRQLPKIGEKLGKNLSKAGINTFEKLATENPRRIEAICGKNAPFGNIIVDLVKSIPILHLKYEINRTGKQFVKIVLTINAPYKRLISQEDFDPYTTYHVIVGDTNNKLLFKRRIRPYCQDKNLYFTCY